MSIKYNVAAYLRLSQDDGDKDVSDSIISQKNIIENKVRELGEDFCIADFYIDDGYTGLNTDRPSFQKMLKDIENGIINCIITKDLSRLSRNSFEANYFIELYFLERDIRYISVLDNVDTGTKNANNDMIQFKTLINDWYSKDISRKIKSSVWARKEKGMFLGATAPYGFRKKQDDKHKLVIAEGEAKIIKRIFEEYNEGKVIKEIIASLQKDKIPSPNNTANDGEIRYIWREETIRRILKNKMYLGHMVYGKRINLSYKSKKVRYIPEDEWKIVENTHEAIVSQELFDNVQRRMKINSQNKKKKHEWSLNGLIKCKECGAKMILKVEYKRNEKDKIKSKKIYCLNGVKKYQGRNCIRGCKGIDLSVVDTIVTESIKKNIEKIVEKNKVKELIIMQNNTNKYNSAINNRRLLEKEIKKVDEEIKNLYWDYRNQILDEDDYKMFYNEKSNEKKRIQKEMEEIKKAEDNKPTLSENELNNIVKEVINMKGVEKDIIFDIISDIQIDNENNIYINYKYDIFNIVNYENI